jgi:hypothetical protein
MSDNPQNRPIGWWIAGFFMVIGVAWITLSGLCTVGVLAMGQFGGEVFPIALMVGGVSALVGFGIYAIAKALRPDDTPPGTGGPARP